MFVVEKLTTTKSACAPFTGKSAARKECEAIMQRIYDENPAYWPYGLDVDSHDGGVYMIREASTGKAIGFTGWQERYEEEDKVGYYSIGILPEYRNNGYAKQAVSKLISLKSASVNKVKALVMKNNEPSLALATALDVPVVKMGNQFGQPNRLKELLTILGTGVGTAGTMDALTFGRDKSWEEYKATPFSTNRVVNGLANVIFGGAAAAPGMSTGSRLGALAAIPAKDVALGAIPAIPSLTESIHTMANKTEAPSGLDALSPGQKAMGLGLAGAGVAGAGYLGLKAIRSLRDMADAQGISAAGKVRVTLPTKDPNDHETVVEIPMHELEVSRAQSSKLMRDMRRKIRDETKQRTVKRNLSTLIPGLSKESKLRNIKTLIKVLHG